MKSEPTTEEKIISLIKLNPGIKAAGLVKKIGITSPAIYHYLNILSFENKIIYKFDRTNKKANKKPTKIFFINEADNN